MANKRNTAQEAAEYFGIGGARYLEQGRARAMCIHITKGLDRKAKKLMPPKVVATILGWSPSKFYRNTKNHGIRERIQSIKVAPKHGKDDFHDVTIKETVIVDGKVTKKVETGFAKGILKEGILNRKKNQRYDLDKVYKWLEEDYPSVKKEIDDIGGKPVPDCRTLKHIRTPEQVLMEEVVVVFKRRLKTIDKRREEDAAERREIVRIVGNLKEFIADTNAGDDLGVTTLADAVNRHDWTSLSQRQIAVDTYTRVMGDTAEHARAMAAVSSRGD